MSECASVGYSKSDLRYEGPTSAVGAVLDDEDGAGIDASKS